MYSEKDKNQIDLAEKLAKEQNFEGALEIYRQLSKDCIAQLSSWQAKNYGRSLRKTGSLEEASTYFEELENQNRLDKYTAPEFAWCLYEDIVKSAEKIDARVLFAINKINALCIQEQYSPYAKAILKFMKLLITPPNQDCQKALEWSHKLDVAKLSEDAFFWNDENGKEMTNGADKERYYSMVIKCLCNMKEYQECYDKIEEVLSNLTNFNNNRDFWFKWYKVKALHGLKRYDEAIDLLEQLILKKKDWFIYDELGSIFLDKNQYDKALSSFAIAALAFGEPSKKIHVYEKLADTLHLLGRDDESRENLMLAVSLYQKNGWAVNRAALNLLNDVGGQPENKQTATDRLRKLKSEWDKMVYSGDSAQHGKIEKLIADGKNGFIRSDKGESHFFQMKSVRSKGGKAKIGDKVTFHLEKGFDSKKNKSVMNAVNIKITS